MNTSADTFQKRWSSFKEAEGEDFFYHWLALQSSLIAPAVQGLLVVGDPESGSYAPVASWPEEVADPERLADICEQVLAERCGLLTELPAPGSGSSGEPGTLNSYAVAYPFMIGEMLFGVVAVEVKAASEESLGHVMEQLQWGSSWLELHHRREQAERSDSTLVEMKSSFDLLAAVLAEERAKDAAMVFVTELASLMRCDRASLGVFRDDHIRLQAMSHSAQLAKNMNLVRCIGTAMEEAILQRSEILFPLPLDAKALVVRDHAELSRQQGGESVLTIPLYGNKAYYGAITLERPADIPFCEKEIRVCRGVFALVAPILEAKRKNDLMLPLKVWASVETQLGKLVGSGHVGRKLLAAALVGLIIFFSVATGDYRITATTVLEPLIRRSIASPFNGYVKGATVRSGDLVKKGAVLCTLDDRDLHLEQSRWQNQQVQYQRQRQEAIAADERAKANIINSQLDQAAAQLNLVRSQLQRTALVAPFDGIVVSGDLSQRIGGAVEQGEVLFEVAPLNAYRVIMQVDEYQIDDVKTGQTGKLVLPTMAEKNFPFVVEKITPISLQKEGKNYFRVEAKLNLVSNSLRPGMEGVAKISVDRRRLISIWTREFRNWLRLKVWYWWP
ncbi:MAG: HlyD family efflux transporter periplasmic adaptor subunit [Geobacter sp.]|nr:HlyD family efflux transporter periplasmic adaptor subunit [Geobacter sp.]